MKTLNIIELFSSVQGETSYTGLPTFFIRTAACNLRCTWCDTTYSFGRGRPQEIEDILQEARLSGCRHVCVTGGEPLLQKPVHDLMRQLADAHFHVSLETGGSLSIEDVDKRVKTILDIKCPGSGMADKMHLKNLNYLRPRDEVKFVLLDRVDYLFAKEFCAKNELWGREILFSPVHDKLDAQQLVKWILEDRLPVRLNLQIHKFIWAPATRGV